MASEVVLRSDEKGHQSLSQYGPVARLGVDIDVSRGRREDGEEVGAPGLRRGLGQKVCGCPSPGRVHSLGPRPCDDGL